MNIGDKPQPCYTSMAGTRKERCGICEMPYRVPSDGQDYYLGVEICPKCAATINGYAATQEEGYGQVQ